MVRFKHYLIYQNLLKINIRCLGNSMKHIIEMAADRGAYICQSQSMNLWMKEPNYKKLTSMHFFSWRKGLKTGLYYLRTEAKAAPQQFTIEPELRKSTDKMSDDEDCLMCGS